jgi:hypothetical protein
MSTNDTPESNNDTPELIEFLDVINMGLNKASHIVERMRDCNIETIGATWGFSEAQRLRRLCEAKASIDRAIIDTMAAMIALPEYEELNRRSVERTLEDLGAQGIHVS